MSERKAVKHGQGPHRMTGLVVEDHPVMRRALADLITEETEVRAELTASDPAEALRLARAHRPEVAMVDLSLGDASGLELIKDLTAEHEAIRILVVSRHEERIYACRCLQAGALGYINKAAPVDQMVAAVRSVAAGQVHLSAEVSRQLLRPSTKHTSTNGTGVDGSVSQLSDRELEVFELLARGLTTRQVAEQLGVSVKTVEGHQGSLKKKLGAANNNQLIVRAANWVLQGA